MSNADECVELAGEMLRGDADEFYCLPLERLRELQVRLGTRVAQRVEEEKQEAVGRVVSLILETHEQEIMPADALLEAVARQLRKTGMLRSVMSAVPVSPAPPTRPARKPRVSQSPPRYRNPGDPSITWTGRGKRPNWFSALVTGCGEDAARAQCEIPAN